MKEQIFERDAKSIVDMLFDKRLFAEGVTRDNMNALELYLEVVLQNRYDSYKRAEKLLNDIKEIDD